MGRVLPMPTQIPADARPSGVLALLFPKDGQLRVLLIERTKDGHAHSGQISFPGGKQEPEDAGLRATALREAQEEVGLQPDAVEVLGALTPLYIPVSNFHVYPFIAYAETAPEYLLSEHEVARILEVPLEMLFHADRKATVKVYPGSLKGLSMTVPAYKLQDETIIWGATAMMLSELEELWRERS